MPELISSDPDAIDLSEPLWDANRLAEFLGLKYRTVMADDFSGPPRHLIGKAYRWVPSEVRAYVAAGVGKKICSRPDLVERHKAAREERAARAAEAVTYLPGDLES